MSPRDKRAHWPQHRKKQICGKSREKCSSCKAGGRSWSWMLRGHQHHGARCRYATGQYSLRSAVERWHASPRWIGITQPYGSDFRKHMFCTWHVQEEAIQLGGVECYCENGFFLAKHNFSSWLHVTVLPKFERQYLSVRSNKELNDANITSI